MFASNEKNIEIGEYIELEDGIYRKISEFDLRKVNTFDFPIGKKEKGELKQIAKKANPAIAAGSIDFSNLDNSIKDYLKYLEKDWNNNFVYSPVLNNSRIRFDSNSFKHFYYSGRKQRSLDELESRAKCLPYIRNIIEENGIKGCCSLDERKHLGFVIMGRAEIDGKDTAIKVIVAKKKKDKLYYLSVNNYGEILK